MTSTAGTIFEGFRLQRQLGEGWLGSVHVAQGLDDGQTVGLKIVKPELAAQTQVMIQFRRLFTKWEHLSHPNVLHPGRLIEHEQHALYTMPLAASGSARQLLQGQIREGQFLDQIVAIDLVRQAADAIAYAHGQNLIHGNLKPENLLLIPAKAIMGRRAYGAVVSDFGLAELQAFTHGTHDRQIVSAPAYMAPEQFKGTRTDPRSDIYSLGVILYELLTNLLPFETNDAAEAADKHLHVAPIPPGQIRVDILGRVEEVILTCMAKSPEYRYRTMAELEEALQACLNELLPQGPRPTMVLPDLPEPPIPNIEPLLDRTPYHRIQVCDERGQLLRVEAVREDQLTIGRAPSNTFVLEHSGISRHHLSLELRDAQLYVTDLGSTNGTTIQGVALAPRAATLWPDGAVLRLEPFWLRLQPPQRVVHQTRIGVLVDTNDIELTPGTLFSLPVQLANTGRTVDHFRVEVDGVPDAWIQNLYTEVQLNPSTTATMNLRILVPPVLESRAQAYPMRVIARSVENPEDIGYAPMNWTVRPFYDTEISFKPQRRSAWRRTHYHLVLRNISNAPLTYRPTIDDEEGEVKLQSPLEQIHLPTGGASLRNIIPVRTIILNTFMRLREGIGKVRILGLPEQITLAPGEEFKQRLDVNMPIRWIATSKLRKLSFDPHPSAGVDRPSSLTLNHLPLIPLWALPLVVLAAVGFGYWMLLTPKVNDIIVEPQKPRPGQPFNIKFNTQNTTWLEVKPFGNKIGNTAKPLLVPMGIPNTTQIQVVAHGRIKTSTRAFTINVAYPAPIIQTFIVDPANITPGQQATLKWNVIGAKTVQIDQLGTVKAQGEKKVPITQDTTFKLTAQNQDGVTTAQSKTVKILPTSVDFFDVIPAQADIGQTVKIRWRVLNSRNVQVEPFGTVGEKEERSWPVHGPQTFTLKIDTGDGPPKTVTKELTVYPPHIEAFTVTPRDAKIGATVTVHWKTSHASNVNISPLGTVAPSGEQSYRIGAANTMFTLTAGNGLTSDTPQQIVVNAMALPPEIQSASVQPSQVTAGQPMTLNWQTTNAVSVELSGLPQGMVSLPPNGSISLSAPTSSTSLIFTAKATDGTVAVKTVPLTVIAKSASSNGTPAGGDAGKRTDTTNVIQTPKAPPVLVSPPAPHISPQPSITQFMANSRMLQESQSTHLHWAAQGVSSVKLFPDGTVYPPVKSISISPKTTTTYTLIAGSARQTITIIVSPRSQLAQPPIATSAIGQGTAPTLQPKPSIAPSPTPAPQVTAATVQKNQIQKGQATTLSWKTTGTTTVSVSPPGKTLPGNSSIIVAPTVTTTYIIQAGDSVKKVTLKVVPPSAPVTVTQPQTVTKPRIVYFRSDDPGLLASSSRGSLLRWQATGVKQVRLMPDNKVLPAAGSYLVKPAATTTYTLIAGTASNTLTLKVFGATTSPNPSDTPDGGNNVDVSSIPAVSASADTPKIVKFEVVPAVVTPGSKVTLSWEVQNSKSIYITSIGSENAHQTASGSVERSVYRTTTFKIDVRKNGKVVQDTATVVVRANPNGQSGDIQ